MTSQQKLTQAILNYQPIHNLIDENSNLNDALSYVTEAILNLDDADDNLIATYTIALTEIIAALAKAGADINSTNDTDQPILHAAINDPDIITELIASGIDVNCIDDVGWTALTRACYNASITSFRNRTVNILLKAGADPNHSPTEDMGEGYTSIMACAESHPETASHEFIPILVSHGGDVHLEDIDGLNALTYAAKSQNLNAAQALVSYGARMPTSDEGKRKMIQYVDRAANATKDSFWRSLTKLT